LVKWFWAIYLTASDCPNRQMMTQKN